MDIHPVSPDAGPLVAAATAVLQAADAVDAPWLPPHTEHGTAGLLRHGWDGDAPRWWVATVAGEPVATGGIFASSYDNADNCWLDVRVHPRHRRRGHGSALLHHLEQQALSDGRDIVGMDGWKSAATSGFAAAHGFEQKYVAVCRRLTIADLPAQRRDEAHADAMTRAGDYELMRVTAPMPPELHDPVAQLSAAINDAPTDDLHIEEEVFPVERIRAYETAQLGRGRRLYRVIARHRASGELGGHTVLAVDEEQPHVGDQHDTSVVAAHRGHRLGLVLKTEMLRWMAEAEPQIEQVFTFNAESNAHMIAVNEALAFRPVGRAPAFQRRARPADAG